METNDAIGQMLAMVCHGPAEKLRLEKREIPEPKGHEILVKVLACGVCRTDLHVVDGEIPANYPVVPGHEIVGRIVTTGQRAGHFHAGQRVGIPWLGKTCGICRFCREGHENLCDNPEFTGATRDGGFASHALADARFCFPLPETLDDVAAAPLLCAGLIGWRAYRMAGDGKRLGLFGFGAAAHVLTQIAVAQGKEIYAFTKPGDKSGQGFAKRLGAIWSGGSQDTPPEPLDAAILFAPVGALVPAALKVVRKGGRVVCAGIHMSDIPSFPYSDLWGEREIVSVANLTRKDGTSFLAPDILNHVQTHTKTFPLAQTNEALRQLRDGEFEGAAVIVP